MPPLTPAHDAVLAILDWLPVETVADAALVAALLAMPEADAAWLLDGLEAAGNFWGAASGPGPDPADTTCDSFGASTVTRPFLTQEVKVPRAAMR